MQNFFLSILVAISSFFGLNHEPVTPPLTSEEVILGGITRTAIGAQTKWTTDLIPSASFTVNLGSAALPVNKIFATNASVSNNFELTNNASIGGNLTLKGIFTGSSTTASNSFTGSLDVTKGFSFPSGKITSSGLVGIGTTNPLVKLQVNPQTPAPLSDPVALSLGGTYGTGTLGKNLKLKFYDSGTSADNYGFGISSQLFEITTGNGADFAFFTNHATTPVELLRIKSTGNVGIGTTAPTALLHLVGNTSTLFNVASGSNSKFAVFETGNASLSLNFEALGYASASFFKGSAFQGVGDCNDATEALGWDAGAFSCVSVSAGGGAFSGLLMHTGVATTPHITDLSFDANMFNFSNIASAGTLTLDWTNGPASRSAANTWSAHNIFSLTASVSGNFEVGTNAFRVFPGMTTNTYIFQIASTSGTDYFNIASNSGNIIQQTQKAASISYTLWGNNGNTQNKWSWLSGGLSGVDRDSMQFLNNGVPLFTISSNSHVIYKQATIPTIACTAGSPTVNAGSTDVAGEFVAGAAATACTVTFQKPWISKPSCQASVDGVTGLALGIQPSTTAVVFNSASIGGTTVSYLCFGYGY